MMDLLNTKDDGVSKTDQVIDFVQSLAHSAVETPINGLSQVLGRAIGTNLPELNLIGAPKEQSTGAALGSIAGMALDYVALSRAGNAVMGGLGGNGLLGSALRTGVVGAVYGGLLTPSDPNSKTFLEDRAGNAGVAALAFGTMAAAGVGLGKTGLFAVPEVRSLTGSVALGGLTGVAGGMAHAEANAVIKDGKPLPTLSAFLNDSATYGAFGAAFGAFDYGYRQVKPELQTYQVNSSARAFGGETDSATARIFKNAQGEIVKVQSAVPASNTFGKVGWEATKMMNGSWWNSPYEVYSNGHWAHAEGHVAVPDLAGVKVGADGSVKLTSTDGDVRTFTPGGQYSKSNPEAEARVAAIRASLPKFDPSDYVDAQGTRYVSVTAEGQSSGGSPGASVTMKGDTVNQVRLGGSGKTVIMTRVSGKSWDLSNSSGKDGMPSRYSWQGDVKATQTADGKISSVEVQPSHSTSFNAIEKSAPVGSAADSVINTARFDGYEPSLRYLRVDGQGNLFIKPGSSVINGKPGGMQEIPIKPGDQMSLTFDVGDRGPDYQTVNLGQADWTKTLDGQTVLLKGEPLKPNTVIPLDVFSKDLVPQW